MTSILTNNSAMAALSTLRSISSGLEETQGRISSGMKVGTAADNAAYWSIATTMRSDASALATVQDAIGLGSAKVDTAYTGMEASIEVVKEIKNKLVTAQESSADKNKIQEEIQQLQDQLKGISDSASFSGENWLKSAIGGSKSVVGSFVRNADGDVTVKKVDYALTGSSVMYQDGVDPETAFGGGIADSEAAYTGTIGADIKVSVNGVESTVSVKTYSTDVLMSDTTSYTFSTNTTTGQTVAMDGTTPAYIKLEGSEEWVQLVSTAPTTGQDIAFNDGTTSFYVNTGDTAGAGSGKSGFSLTTLNVTQLGAAGLAMGGATQDEALAFMTQFVDDQLGKMTSAAANLGSISMRIGLQEDFLGKLSDSLDAGIGRLVDADMNEESTRLKALQTQQQLAVQALSIANSDSQNILSLFR